MAVIIAEGHLSSADVGLLTDNGGTTAGEETGGGGGRSNWGHSREEEERPSEYLHRVERCTDQRRSWFDQRHVQGQVQQKEQRLRSLGLEGEGA